MLQALNPNKQSQKRSLTDDWRILYISSLTLMQHCNRSMYCTKSFSCLAEVEKFGWSAQTKCGNGFRRINHEVQELFVCDASALVKHRQKHPIWEDTFTLHWFIKKRKCNISIVFLRYQITVGWLSWLQYCKDIYRIFFFNAVKWYIFFFISFYKGLGKWRDLE